MLLAVSQLIKSFLRNIVDTHYLLAILVEGEDDVLSENHE